MSKIMNEYDGLRNEIISMEEQQRNVWIYMYVLFVTLFVLGIEFSYNLFLITYVVLIPFQIVINRYRLSISKISTYIRIFYEEDVDELNWENFQVYDGYKKYYRKLSSGIPGKIRDTGVSQLGILSTSFYILFMLYNKFNNDTFKLSVIDILLIILSIILFFITMLLNKEYTKNYDEELEYVINNYKNSLKSTE